MGPDAYDTCCTKLAMPKLASNPAHSGVIVGSISGPSTSRPINGVAVGAGVAAGAAAAAGLGVLIAGLAHNANVAQTTLSTAANPGDTSLNVVDGTKFHVGDSISIGGISVRTISGFGSIIVDRPLTRSFQLGVKIVQL